MNQAVIKREVNKKSAEPAFDIPNLATALDPTRMQKPLATIAGYIDGQAHDVKVTRCELVRHKPKRRCMVRYDLLVSNSGFLQRYSLLGKIRARSYDHKTYQLTRRLWQSEFGPHGLDAIRVPQPVGAIPELHMWLQRVVGAQTVTEQLECADAAELCRIAAATVAKLHKSGPLAGKVHSTGNEIAILKKNLEFAKASIPRLAGRIERIEQACGNLAARLKPLNQTTIHRDFYPDQILVRDRAAWLLDLDLCSFGDPAIDIGNFLAHLQEASLRRYGHLHGYAHLENAFLSGYESATGSRLSASIPNYVTLTLARHIGISQKFAARRMTTERLIQACERRLSIASADLGAL